MTISFALRKLTILIIYIFVIVFIFVSQGATINQLLKKLLNDPSFDLRFTNTSLTILERREEKWECTLLNCSKHLGKEILICTINAFTFFVLGMEVPERACVTVRNLDPTFCSTFG
jgi:hypothetical protein